MRRDAWPHAVGEEPFDALPELREALEPGRRVGAEDLEVDRGAQTEIRAGDRRRAAVAAVADGRDAGREALRGAEPRDVDVLVPADPRLALDVQRDPLGEVAEAVAETAVDRVLEVRVGVDEARDDHRVLVVRAGTELVGGADRGDAAVLDRDCAVLDRRALDRKHPVGGKDLAHGSVRLAASVRGARRSTSTPSQIEPS